MDYKIDDELIKTRQNGYIKFWGREPDSVAHQTDDEIPHVDVYRFPSVKSKKKRLNDLVVYISGGMSDIPMPNMDDFDDCYKYAEIVTYAYEPLITNSGDSDFISWICHWMAHYPFSEETPLLCGETFDWENPIVPDSQMEGFYFAHPPFIDREKLLKHSVTAKALIYLVPISRLEMNFRLDNGVEALLTHFEESEVNPVFDLSRLCSMSDSKEK